MEAAGFMHGDRAHRKVRGPDLQVQTFLQFSNAVPFPDLSVLPIIAALHQQSLASGQS